MPKHLLPTPLDLFDSEMRANPESWTNCRPKIGLEPLTRPTRPHASDGLQVGVQYRKNLVPKNHLGFSQGNTGLLYDPRDMSEVRIGQFSVYEQTRECFPQ